jgi:hypothetical protein
LKFSRKIETMAPTNKLVFVAGVASIGTLYLSGCKSNSPKLANKCHDYDQATDCNGDAQCEWDKNGKTCIKLCSWHDQKECVADDKCDWNDAGHYCTVKAGGPQCSDYHVHDTCVAHVKNGCKWNDGVTDDGCAAADGQKEALGTMEICKEFGGELKIEKTCTEKCSDVDLKLVTVEDLTNLKDGDKIDVVGGANGESCSGTFEKKQDENGKVSFTSTCNGKEQDPLSKNPEQFADLINDNHIMKTPMAVTCTDNQGCAVKDGKCTEKAVDGKKCADQLESCPDYCKKGNSEKATPICYVNDSEIKIDCKKAGDKPSCQFKVGDKTFKDDAKDFDKICVYKTKCSGTFIETDDFDANKKNCGDLITEIQKTDAEVKKLNDKGTDATPDEVNQLKDLTGKSLKEALYVTACEQKLCEDKNSADCKDFLKAAKDAGVNTGIDPASKIAADAASKIADAFS